MGLDRFTLIADGVTHELTWNELRGAASRVTVDVRAGELAKVFLEFPADVEVQGEGLIHVVKDLDHRQVLLEWIDAIDPAGLEQLALDPMFDGADSTGDRFKAALKRLVSGD